MAKRIGLRSLLLHCLQLLTKKSVNKAWAASACPCHNRVSAFLSRFMELPTIQKIFFIVETSLKIPSNGKVMSTDGLLYKTRKQRRRKFFD
ncbi:MAG: hypothetical protein V7K79_09090 [Nostoc sp.]